MLTPPVADRLANSRPSLNLFPLSSLAPAAFRAWEPAPVNPFGLQIRYDGRWLRCRSSNYFPSSPSSLRLASNRPPDFRHRSGLRGQALGILSAKVIDNAIAEVSVTGS